MYIYYLSEYRKGGQSMTHLKGIFTTICLFVVKILITYFEQRNRKSAA